MDYLYGKLNNEVKYREYKGSETTTATVTIDDSNTVSVDVKRVPNELTLTTINGDTYTYDGSEPASFDIRTQVTDKVEEGNNLPVTSDAVKGYVDSKAGALEYVGGEGNFTNIDGGVTIKGRVNVDDGIYSPVTSDDPNFVPNNKSVDDKITASEQKLIDERIGAFTRTEDKLFTDVTGGMTIKGKLNVDGGITSASAPIADTDVANKGYVDDGFVHKGTELKAVYTRDENGNERMISYTENANAWTLVQRANGGVVKVGTPVSACDAVTKEYADDRFAPLLHNEEQNDKVYIQHGNQDGTSTTRLIACTTSPYPNFIVKRSATGTVKCATPEGDSDATTKKYVDDADAKKLNLTGGTITGSLAIQGDLTVTGTTTTEKAQTLAVKDSVIITNADGAELGATLSGIAIRKDGENTYGIMYDPSGNSVKLGLGTLDAENKFTFNESGTDGKPIATRDDSGNLTDGDLVRWDGTTKSLVDSGKKTDDFVEKVTVTEGSNLAYIAKNDGTQGTLPVATGAYSNTLAQRTTNGRLLVGTAVEDSDAMPKKQVDDNFIPKSTFTGAWQVLITGKDSNTITTRTVSGDPSTDKIVIFDGTGRLQTNNPDGTAPTSKSNRYAVNVGYANTNYVAKIAPPDQFVYAYGYSGNTPVLLKATSSATANQLAYRGTGGVLSVGTPTEDAHATTKKYVDGSISNSKISAINLTKGITSVSYDATKGVLMNGTSELTLEDGTKKDATMDVEVPIVAGDGIIIDKVSGSEQVEIKADTDTLGGFFMPLVGNGEIPAINYSGQAVGKYYGPFSGGIPTYSDDTVGEDTGGNFLYAMTTGSENLGDSDKSKFRLTNKQYVDDGFVAKVTSTDLDRAYVAKSDGTQTTFAIDTAPNAWRIARRGENGTLQVGTPVGVNDATTKQYVDTAINTVNTITITAGA